ncbi:hypothetical protein JXB41_02900 [Candidatus Woesearchaeota archaeon]|nr:hypothetical protein [Candidatus Woesearchaeota archaeon]
MKRISVIAILFLFAMSVVFANGVGSPDEECRQHGFDYGIAKWDWVEEAYVLSAEGVRPGYTVSISGDAASATWKCNPGAAGALSKEGTYTYVHSGGTSGTVTPSLAPDGKTHDISHITLCGNENDGQVPEFTTIGAGLALLGAGAIICRKRKK